MTAYRPNGTRAETDHGATRGVDGVALAGVLFSVALPAYAEVAATEAHAAMSWEDVYDPDQLLGQRRTLRGRLCDDPQRR
ncbi:MAG: hypothetical protein ACO23O_01555, partial [Ilumatobacteraceae bacterium]